MAKPLLIGVAALCVALLGGAFWAASALTSDVRAPEGSVVTPVVAPIVVRSPTPAPAPLPPPRPVSAPAPSGAPALPVAQAVVEPPPAAPAAPAVDPESDYAKEHGDAVDQTWELVNGPRSDPASWRRAVKEFRRCLTQNPENSRCVEGLKLAEAKLQAAGEQVPELRRVREGFMMDRQRPNRSLKKSLIMR